MPSNPRSNASRQDDKNKGRPLPKEGLDVNAVLRRAYESAVDESIPPSMLELLGKLS